MNPQLRPEMQNDAASSRTREKRPSKSCCLLALAACLVCFLIVTSGIACIIIVDSINLRGEEFSFSRRVERYKVACQFIWFDLKSWVSRQFSDEPPPQDDSSL